MDGRYEIFAMHAIGINKFVLNVYVTSFSPSKLFGLGFSKTGTEHQTAASTHIKYKDSVSSLRIWRRRRRRATKHIDENGGENDY